MKKTCRGRRENEIQSIMEYYDFMAIQVKKNAVDVICVIFLFVCFIL